MCGCRVIKVDQGFVMDHHVQDRKIVPNMEDIKTHNVLIYVGGKIMTIEERFYCLLMFV
jgi:hypothetical protein